MLGQLDTLLSTTAPPPILNMPNLGDIFQLEGINFEIKKKLGQGGRSAVYAARDLEDGTMVALKVELPLGEAESATQAYEAEHELKMLAILGRLVAHEVIDGKRFTAMQLMPGVDLSAHLDELKQLIAVTNGIKDPKLAGYFKEVLKIAKQFCQTVNDFHNMGFLHRDIKPENMMYDCDGDTFTLNLIDLGGAVSRDEDISGVAYGTSNYMAPEFSSGAQPSLSTEAYAVGQSLNRLMAADLLGAPRMQMQTKRTHKEDYERLQQVTAGLTQADPAVRMSLVDAIAVLENNNVCDIDIDAPKVTLVC